MIPSRRPDCFDLYGTWKTDPLVPHGDALIGC
jgi:hypothetical protein